MNTVVQHQLEGVENALNALIDSIASFNPSVGAATALLAAEDSLQVGLEQLAVHQQNHAQITRLQERLAKQDEGITSIVNLLAETRTDLLLTPTSIPSKVTRTIPYRDLLDYARRVSRFTVPFGFRPVVLSSDANVDYEGEAGKDSELAQAGGIGLESLQQAEKQWLDPSTGTQFTPWPSEDVNHKGALGKIQMMLEKNIDPSEVVREGIEKSGGLDKDPEAAQTELNSTMIESSSTVDGIRAERKKKKPKVFGGLELYNPEAPDDDG